MDGKNVASITDAVFMQFGFIYLWNHGCLKVLLLRTLAETVAQTMADSSIQSSMAITNHRADVQSKTVYSIFVYLYINK